MRKIEADQFLTRGYVMDTPSSSAFEPTIEIASGPPTSAASVTRKLALNLSSSGSRLTQHEQELLRIRLRIAAFVLFFGFALFLVLGVFGYAGPMANNQYVFLSHLITTATLGLCAFSLCQKCKASQLRLRLEEAIVFGMPAGFFALANVMELNKCAAEHSYLPDPFGSWSMLCFTYALFIPNRVRRGTIIIATIAMVPVVIVGVMLLTSSTCQLAHNANALFFVKGLLVMIVTAVIASTGAARIGTLRKEAFAAKELGQYRLKERIGRGGMGEVYLAEHRLIKRPCAVKLIRSDRARDPQALARFEREVQAAANLTHWNSVNVYDYGHTDDGTFYFVMEYLPGMSLHELVSQHGPLTSGRTIYFLRQVCNALQEAHDRNFVHRDLKPANIFAAHIGGEHDVAKLLDFGLVKDATADESAELTMMGTIAGSPLFMAPETATGDSDPDVRSDIYSLGCVAYFLLTGQPPFPGENPLKILMAHASEEVQPLAQANPDITNDLESVVMLCLRKNPEERPQSAMALQTLLEECRDANAWDRSAAHSWWSKVEIADVSKPAVGDLAPTIG